MDEKRYRNNIARNLTAYRKRCDLTQAQLAEKISYSDKAISKWERGEGVPDTLVMLQLCEIFDISLNDLVADKIKKKAPYFLRNRFIIAILSCLIVWLVAVLAFVVIGMLKPDLEIAWICYVYAIPVSFIVLVVFSALWGKKWVKFITITGLIWTLLLSIYLSITIFDDSAKSAWMIFLIGIPIEVAFLFFFLLKKKSNL